MQFLALTFLPRPSAAPIAFGPESALEAGRIERRAFWAALRPAPVRSRISRARIPLFAVHRKMLMMRSARLCKATPPRWWYGLVLVDVRLRIIPARRFWMRKHRGLTDTTLDFYEGILAGLLDTLGDEYATIPPRLSVLWC